VATLDGLREAVPGQPLPEIPDSAYGPDSVPLDFAPLEDAPTFEEGELTALSGDPEADAAAMVAATPPEVVERAMAAVLLASDLAASNAARGGDTDVPAGDTAGDELVGEEVTAGGTPAVTSEDTTGDTEDTSGDAGGDSDSSDPAAEEDDTGAARPYACDQCPRTFKSERGRDSHRRQVHGEG
jgi:hypothetical protein